VLFKFVSIERVGEGVASIDYFASWPNLERVIFAQNSIRALTQLDWLSKLAPQIKEVRRVLENELQGVVRERQVDDDDETWLSSLHGFIPCYGVIPYYLRVFFSLCLPPLSVAHNRGECV
jgi:hypothetical protein